MRQQHIHINDTKLRDIDYKMYVTAPITRHIVCENRLAAQVRHCYIKPLMPLFRGEQHHKFRKILLFVVN
jgi:histidyl-tRNA synthetase